MARIPESEIERIKREVSIERLVEASGVELKRVGKDLFGRCPFHAPDDTPSLSITPAKNLWHCLGACNEGGDVFAWVMKLKGISFRHAYELLNTDPSLAAARSASRLVRRSTVRALASPVAPDADEQRLLNQVVDYYREELKRSPEALAYAKARGIDHPEAIERFKLGFANRTLGLRLPEKHRAAGAHVRARLQKLGILRSSGHEHFTGSLVIPILDEHGNVTEIYGRKITPGLRPGTPLHLYLPGAHRGVWNLEALQASKEIILCEALIDALTFWCAGLRNVTASYGVGGFTDDHLAAFQRYGTERVLIAYDRDEAGDRAAGRLAGELAAEGIESYRVEFPKGMDANEYALKVQPAAKSLGLVIRKAVWLGGGTAPARPISTIAAEPELEVRELPARAASPLAVEAAKEEPPEAVPAAEASPAPTPAAIEALPASRVPAAPSEGVPVEVREAEIVFSFGANGDARRYRVRGLAKNLAYDVLKVNVAAEKSDAIHVDTVDLRAAKPKAAYVTQAARELGLTEELVNADLRKVFRKLEELQERQIQGTLAPKPEEPVQMAEPERQAALELLRSPRLMERIPQDLAACGLVGETVNKLVAYLAATSRKLDQPLAILVQSSSAAGKTSLMDAVLAMMPEEERLKYSAVTGQSLFYLGDEDLKHKILAIVEGEGASRAAYALKLLQSEGELTIASTGKDPETGELKAQTYRVEGPVALFSTTTAADIDPELQNRCLVLAIDEERAQTQAIHRAQRERRTLAGLIARAEREELRAVHRNAQRLLKPLAVLNPYAPALTFPDSATRLRRDHEKYLTLIDVIALLHQYQREPKRTSRHGKPIEYVEATLADIAAANELAHEVLGRSLDELPPQTRRVLGLLDRFVAARAQAQGVERAQVRFSRRELREATGVGDTQLRLHLERLIELEYVLARRDGAGGRFVYELVYDGQGQGGRPFVPGLIDVERLRAMATTREVAGVNAEVAAASDEVAGRLRADRGPVAGGSRGGEIAETPRQTGDSSESASKATKPHSKSGNGEDPSYTQPSVAPLAARSR
jgi:DNA primase catalytic core